MCIVNDYALKPKTQNMIDIKVIKRKIFNHC